MPSCILCFHLTTRVAPPIVITGFLVNIPNTSTGLVMNFTDICNIMKVFSNQDEQISHEKHSFPVRSFYVKYNTVSNSILHTTLHGNFMHL